MHNLLFDEWNRVLDFSNLRQAVQERCGSISCSTVILLKFLFLSGLFIQPLPFFCYWSSSPDRKNQRMIDMLITLSISAGRWPRQSY